MIPAVVHRGGCSRNALRRPKSAARAPHILIFLVSFFAVAGLVAVHLFSEKLRFLETTPRSVWLSVAGGVSVAYVFVHLIPELAENQEVLAEAAGESLAFLERHVYLVALIGLATFYGLERAARVSRGRGRGRGEKSPASVGVFWLHMFSFSVYNAIIGYLLLHREDQGLGTLLFFFLAMALHFLVNDFGLREHHRDTYRRTGRWVLAAAIFLGWVVGVFTEISEAALAVLIAFIAGGVILNVLKEELPEERQSRFWAFALGAAAYAALLIAL